MIIQSFMIAAYDMMLLHIAMNDKTLLTHACAS